MTGVFPKTSLTSLNQIIGIPNIISFIRGEAAKTAYRLKANGDWFKREPSETTATSTTNTWNAASCSCVRLTKPQLTLHRLVNTDISHMESKQQATTKILLIPIQASFQASVRCTKLTSQLSLLQQHSTRQKHQYIPDYSISNKSLRDPNNYRTVQLMTGTAGLNYHLHKIKKVSNVRSLSNSFPLLRTTPLFL